MTNRLLSFLTLLMFTVSAYAEPGDTVIVQTFTHEEQNDPENAYDSPGRRWFEFPASGNGDTYQKILMYYNLKCFEDGTAGNLGFPCGEWDYLTYTYLYDHTGELDSSLVVHPLLLINNQDFTTAGMTSQQPLVIHQYVDDHLDVSATISESMHELGGITQQIAGPFSGSLQQRTQYLYRADELQAAGLDGSAPIRKLAFEFTGNAAMFNMLRIRMSQVEDDAISSIQNISLTEVYHHNTLINGDGWQEFFLETPFEWNGISNILVDVSYTNEEVVADAPLCTAVEMDYSCMSALVSDDRYLDMDWNDEVRIPAGAFDAINEQVSICFWNYGDPLAQPQDGTLFEGSNAQNQRVLNVHLPWSNGRIYWDAGQDNGYDRIDKAAAVVDYEGRWNHWCFTKNALTGFMKIYLNGVLWHSGEDKDNLMDGIENFSIGGATSWENFYRGRLDEFAIFNVELDESVIAAWMHQDLDPGHPNWNDLRVYYKFNEGDGSQVIDASGNGFDAYIHGNAARTRYRGEELWRNSGGDFFRPLTRFITGDYTTSIVSGIASWTEHIPPVSIVEYVAVSNDAVIASIDYDWYAGESFTITPEGDTIFVVPLPAEYTINNSTFSYYEDPFEVINRFELNRFITMYGIQLDLGDDGWTWVTDVTDWAPLLRDSVELESGNWQELLDLKFLFIEGTPARDVLRVERIWDTNVGLNNFDAVVTDKVIVKQEGEEGWKLLTTNTGHGFGSGNNCGEFCNNMQGVDVNEVQQWEWEIMQECADNPLYPQGGTWIYDRAGWCPGMNSTTKEFELTSLVQGQDEFSVDYDITSDPYGNYVFFGTLIGYGAPHHDHDPEIDMITAPSDWKIHSRWNPMCDNPRFILRNKGTEPLTDINIYYGVAGGEMQALHWTGEIGFMEREEIELTYTFPEAWQGADDELLQFEILLGFSADGVDENAANNYARSSFYRPPAYAYPDLDDNRLIIQLKTNDAYWQSAYTLYDINGNIVFSKDDFSEANTTYRDTIQLNTGCYMFHLMDSEEDGLYFFANDDGTGNCKLDRVSGGDFISFEQDFGKEIRHYFQWKTDVVSVAENDPQRSLVKVFPNPASGYCSLVCEGFERKISLAIYDSRGVLVFLDESVNRRSVNEQVNINLSGYPDGIYSIVVSDSTKRSTTKIIVN